MNGTRKILPWTMWLSAKEHMFAKEVAHAFIYACIHIIDGNCQSFFKVCGCNSACIYSMVIAITLGGLPPKLELLAVFSSSDTVVSMYTVGHALL